MVSLTNAYRSIRSTFTTTNIATASSSSISNYSSSTSKETTNTMRKTTTTLTTITPPSSPSAITLLMKRKPTIMNNNKKKDKNKKKVTEAQKKVQNQIEKLPTPTKEYLTSLHCYKQEPALATKQGHNDSRKLQRIPSDILPTILQHLTAMELLHCCDVSQTWCHFILYWPVFWEKICTSGGFSQGTMATIKLLLCGQTRELCLEGSVGTELNIALQLLVHSSANQFLKSLSIKDVRISDTDGDLIAKTVKSIPTLKRLEFINCCFQVISSKSATTIIQTILQSCSKKVTHLSFYQIYQIRSWLPSNSKYYNEFVNFPSSHDMSALSFPSLTHLKLVGSNLYTSHDQRSIKLSSRMGSRCPNLVYLHLDVSVLTDERCRSIIQDVVKYCPNLLDIIVSEGAKMPWTCITSTTAAINALEINKNNDKQLLSSRNVIDGDSKCNDDTMAPIMFNNTSGFSSSPSSSCNSLVHTSGSNNNARRQHQQLPKTVQGYRTIVLDSVLYVTLNQLGASTGILGKTHATLELLYLRCQLQGNSCYKTFNTLVSSYDYPQLREIVLSLKSMNQYPGTATINITSSQPNNNKTLKHLFVQCPNLEAITINTFNVINDPNVQVNDDVLKSIACNCPRLRHLHVLGRRQHTTEGMKQFSTVGGIHLTELEMDIDRDALLTTIIRLKSLRRLVLRSDTWSSKNRCRMPFFSDMVTARRVLYERGGALIEHSKGSSDNNNSNRL